MLSTTGATLAMMLVLSTLGATAASAAPFTAWHSFADARFTAPLADGGRILEVRTRPSSNGTFGDRGYRFSASDAFMEALVFADHGNAVWDGVTGMVVLDHVPSPSPPYFFARATRGLGSALPGFTLGALDSSANAIPTSWSVAAGDGGDAWFVGVTQVGPRMRTRLWRTAADGTPASGWPASGRNLWTADDLAYPVILADASGGAVVFGARYRFSPAEETWLQTSRVLSSGTPDPAWNHSPINSIGGEPSEILRVSGGYLLIYRAIDSPGVWLWRALRITDTGALAVGWPATGVALGRVTDFEARHPFLDGNDGLYFIDTSDAPALHRVLGDGSTPLGPDGVVIAPVGSQPVADLDGAGGLLLAWTEDVAGQQHVRVRGIDATGATLSAWPDTGLAVSAPVTGHLQRPIAVTSDGAGGAIVAWQDYWVACSCGASASLTRVAAPAVLDAPPLAPPARLALTALGAHPVRGTLRLTIDSAVDAETEITLHDLAGRVLRRARVAGGARREVTWSLAGIAPGVVLARATQSGGSVTRRVVVVQ